VSIRPEHVALKARRGDARELLGVFSIVATSRSLVSTMLASQSVSQPASIKMR
jgi:hypothetical protein